MPHPRVARWLAAATLAAIIAPRPAAAGVCVSEDELDEYVVALEAAAKDPAKGADLGDYWDVCLEGNQPRRARVVAACTRIAARLDLDPKRPPATTEHRCVEVLVSLGVNPVKTKTRVIDYVGDRLGQTYGPYDEVEALLRRLARSGDPRVLPWVIAQLRANLATTAAKPPRGWRAQVWFKWRRAAIAAIAALGSASDIPVLDELAAVTKDKRLTRQIASARAKLAAPPR